MTRRHWPALAAIPMLTIALSAGQTPPAAAPQQPPAQGQGQGQGQGRGGRGQQTPAQREAAAREAHEREAALPRPVPARDSVWIEELTYLEVRDAIKAGKTTALVMAGSTEQNGPYMSGGKHQYAIHLVGEAVARKLGNALIAPVIPIEAGNPENPYLEWGSLYFTPETFQAVAVTPAARRAGTTTPWPPKAAVERSTAPRLRGSVTPSSATTRAGADPPTVRKSSGWAYSYAGTCSTSPWCGDRPPSRSSSPRGASSTGIRASPASFSDSRTRSSLSMRSAI